MTNKIDWLIENRVIYAIASDKFTVGELLEAEREIVSCLDAADKPLHLVFDLSKTTQVPPISAIRRVTMAKHERFGIAIAVGHLNSLVRTIIVLAASFFRMQVHIVDSVAQAREVLYRLDPTLPNAEVTSSHIHE